VQTKTTEMQTRDLALVVMAIKSLKGESCSKRMHKKESLHILRRLTSKREKTSSFSSVSTDLLESDFVLFVNVFDL
jgi:hypothetical protein